MIIYIQYIKNRFKNKSILIITSLIISSCYDNLKTSPKTIDEVSIDIRFSPPINEESCKDLIIKSILEAKKTIFMLTYQYPSIEIMNALLEMNNKVEIIIIVDKKIGKQRISQLTNQGLNVKSDFPNRSKNKFVGCAHNKIIIVDNTYVITGSYNFTKSAENYNLENLIKITNSTIAQTYTNYFLTRLKVIKKREGLQS